ncbi:nucleotidyltransferase domain-containing protein [Candidatus Woesearchaeota archaeon]|nr:nucleotidyltransferase domain-containing protein [Candidatus Woesearchaeota archaeon]
MQKQIIQEQIRKRVARSGNSGAVWVPKNWLGEEIVVTRLATPKLSMEEELLHILLPHLKDISAIFLYGSCARKEETRDSDIDILIIAKHTFTPRTLKRFDITVIEHEKMHDAVQKNPFVYAIIQEAKPLFNSHLLNVLQHTATNFTQFIRWYKETTEDSILSTKELLDLDRLESTYLTSYSVIYSLLLRFRGVFLIQSVLHHKAFSNSSFKKYMTAFIPESLFAKFYMVYKQVRDNRKIDILKIEITLVEKLVQILRQEVKKLHAK